MNPDFKEVFEKAFEEAQKLTLEKTGLPSQMIDDKWIALWSARFALSYAEKVLIERKKFYDIKVFPEPIAGQHGKTVDSCSARAMRICIEQDAAELHNLRKELE